MADDVLQDKASLLKRIRKDRAAIDSVLAQVGAVDMDSPVTDGGWTVRDVMAHITWWEHYALERLQEAQQGQSPQLLGHLSEADVEQINAEAHAEGRAKSLATVETEYPNVHQQLMAAIEDIPEDRSASWWTLWPDEDSVWALVSYNTWGHYGEHLPDLKRWQAEHDDD